MNVFKKVFLFYYEGFRSMTLGKTLWMIILISLTIYSDLSSKGDTKEEKSEYIVNEMEKRTINN